jgi:hypothetical protein
MSDSKSIEFYSNILNKEVENLSTEAKASLDTVKKIALSEAWKILQLAIAKIIQTLEIIATDLSGSEKKIVAMTSLSLFYDNVLRSISIPMIPSWLEPILRKYIKAIFVVLISSSIDAMVATFRQVGVFAKHKQHKEDIAGYQGYQTAPIKNPSVKTRSSKKRKKQ